MKMKTMLLGAALTCVYPLLAATVGPDWCVVYPESGSEDVNRVLRIAAEEVRDDINETTGTGPARCAFSVGLEFGDRPCAIAPMMPAYAKASAFADATADKSARQAGR